MRLYARGRRDARGMWWNGPVQRSGPKGPSSTVIAAKLEHRPKTVSRCSIPHRAAGAPPDRTPWNRHAKLFHAVPSPEHRPLRHSPQRLPHCTPPLAHGPCPRYLPGHERPHPRPAKARVRCRRQLVRLHPRRSVRQVRAGPRRLRQRGDQLRPDERPDVGRHPSAVEGHADGDGGAQAGHDPARRGGRHRRHRLPLPQEGRRGRRGLRHHRGDGPGRPRPRHRPQHPVRRAMDGRRCGKAAHRPALGRRLHHRLRPAQRHPHRRGDQGGPPCPEARRQVLLPGIQPRRAAGAARAVRRLFLPGAALHGPRGGEGRGELPLSGREHPPLPAAGRSGEKDRGRRLRCRARAQPVGRDRRHPFRLADLGSRVPYPAQPDPDGRHRPDGRPPRRPAHQPARHGSRPALAMAPGRPQGCARPRGRAAGPRAGRTRPHLHQAGAAAVHPLRSGRRADGGRSGRVAGQAAALPRPSGPRHHRGGVRPAGPGAVPELRRQAGRRRLHRPGAFRRHRRRAGGGGQGAASGDRAGLRARHRPVLPAGGARPMGPAPAEAAAPDRNRRHLRPHLAAGDGSADGGRRRVGAGVELQGRRHFQRAEGRLGAHRRPGADAGAHPRLQGLPRRLLPRRPASRQPVHQRAGHHHRRRFRHHGPAGPRDALLPRRHADRLPDRRLPPRRRRAFRGRLRAAPPVHRDLHPGLPRHRRAVAEQAAGRHLGRPAAGPAVRRHRTVRDGDPTAAAPPAEEHADGGGCRPAAEPQHQHVGAGPAADRGVDAREPRAGGAVHQRCRRHPEHRPPPPGPGQRGGAGDPRHRRRRRAAAPADRPPDAERLGKPPPLGPRRPVGDRGPAGGDRGSDAIGDRPAFAERRHRGGHLPGAERRVGDPSDMGGDADLRMTPERMVRRQRLRREDIQAGAAQMPALQRVEQVRFDLMAAARRVDDNRPLGQCCEQRRIQDAASLVGQRQQADQHIALRQHRRQPVGTGEALHPLDALGAAAPAHQAVFQRPQRAGRCRPQFAHPQDADGHLGRRAMVQLLPPRLGLEGVVAVHQPVPVEHLEDDVAGHVGRQPVRHHAHQRHVRQGRVLQDRLHPGAERHDQLQVGQGRQHAGRRLPHHGDLDVGDVAGLGPDAHLQAGKMTGDFPAPILGAVAGGAEQKPPFPNRARKQASAAPDPAEQALWRAAAIHRRPGPPNPGGAGSGEGGLRRRPARPRQRGAAGAERRRPADCPHRLAGQQDAEDLLGAGGRRADRRGAGGAAPRRDAEGRPHPAGRGAADGGAGVAVAARPAGALPRRHPHQLDCAHHTRGTQPAGPPHDGGGRFPHPAADPLVDWRLDAGRAGAGAVAGGPPTARDTRQRAEGPGTNRQARPRQAAPNSCSSLSAITLAEPECGVGIALRQPLRRHLGGTRKLPAAGDHAHQLQQRHRRGGRQARVLFRRGQHPGNRLLGLLHRRGQLRPGNAQGLISVAGQFASQRRDLVKQAVGRRPAVAQELAVDQVVGLDGGRALIDRGDAGVAQMLGGAGLLDETHAAMDLHAIRRQLLAGLGAPALGDGGQQIDQQAGTAAGGLVGVMVRHVHRGGGGVEDAAHRLDPRLHAHQQAADVGVVDDALRLALDPAQRLALHAVAGIGQRLLVGALGDRQALHGDVQPGVVHHGEHVFQAAVRLADQESGRPALIAEGQHGGRAAMDAQLVLQRHALHLIAGAQAAVGIDQEFRHDEQADALHARGRIGQAGQHQMDDVLRQVMVAVGDEDLLSADEVMVAVRHRARPRGGEVASRLRLRDVHGAGPLARDHPGQIEVLQHVGAIELHSVHRPLRQHRAEREGHVGGMPHLLHRGVQQVGQPHAAARRIEGQPVPAALDQRLPCRPPALRRAGDAVGIEPGALDVADAVQRRQDVLGDLRRFAQDAVHHVGAGILETRQSRHVGHAGEVVEDEADLFQRRGVGDRGGGHGGPLRVGDEAVVGDLEDRRLLVLVDGDDDLAVLHAGQMLDGARDADGDIEVRRDDLAGLADLIVVRDEAGIDGGAAGTDGGPQLVGDGFQQVEIVARLHAAPAGNDDAGRGQLRPLRLRQLGRDEARQGGIGRSSDVLDRGAAGGGRRLERGGADGDHLHRVGRLHGGDGVAGIDRPLEAVGRNHGGDLGNHRDIQQGRDARSQVLAGRSGGREDVAIAGSERHQQGCDRLGQSVLVGGIVGEQHLGDAGQLRGLLRGWGGVAAGDQEVDIAAELAGCGHRMGGGRLKAGVVVVGKDQDGHGAVPLSGGARGGGDIRHLDAGLALGRLGDLHRLQTRRDIHAQAVRRHGLQRLLLRLHDVRQRGVTRLIEAQIGGDHRRQLQRHDLKSAVDLAGHGNGIARRGDLGREGALSPAEQRRQHLAGLVAVVVDGLLAENDEAGGLLLHQRLQHLGDGQRLGGDVGLHQDGAVCPHGESGAERLLGLGRADGNHHDLGRRTGFLETNRFLDGDLVEGVHREFHVGRLDPGLVGLHPDLDVVIDDALDGAEDLHGAGPFGNGRRAGMGGRCPTLSPVRRGESGRFGRHAGKGQGEGNAPRPLQPLGLLAQDVFLDLAGGGLRQRAEHHRARALEVSHVRPAEGDDVGLGRGGAVLQRDEGAGRLAPLLVMAGDDGGLQHLWMLVEHILHLDGRDVLATGDDDVLRAVLDLDIAVFMPDGEIAGVEPAAGEGLLGRLGVLQIPLHDVVSTHHDLAHGAAVLRHRLQREGIGDDHRLQHRAAHALARLDRRLLVQRQAVPAVVPDADDGRAIAFGQAVDMGDFPAHALHPGNDGGGRSGAGDHHLDLVIDALLQLGRGIVQHVEDDGRAAEVGHPLVADQLENGVGADLTQADGGAGGDRDGPGEAPAVAVEHRQRPQIHGRIAHVPGQRVRHRVQVGAAVVIDDALRVAGGAGGVVQRDGLPFVGRQGPGVLGTDIADEGLVIAVADQLAAAVGRIVDVHHRNRCVEQGQRLLRHAGELAVDDQDLRLAMLQDEGDGLGIQAGVDGVQHGAGQRHAEMGLEQFRRVGGQHGDGVAGADAQIGQRRGQTAHADEGLGPGPAHRAVDDGQPVGPHRGGALQEGQRRQGDEIGGVAVEVALVRVYAGIDALDRCGGSFTHRTVLPRGSLLRAGIGRGAEVPLSAQPAHVAGEQVTGAIDRLDQPRRAGILLDLLADARDADIDAAVIGEIVAILIRALQMLARQHALGRLQQHQQKRGLRRGQAFLPAVVGGQRQVAEVEHPGAEAGPKRLRGGGGAGQLLAAADGTVDAGDKFPRLERLHDIVVGAKLQPQHPVGGAAAPGQDDDAEADILPKLAHQGQPVHVRQAEIDEAQVGGLTLDRRPRLPPAGPAGHLIAVALQHFRHQPPDVGLVLDHIDALLLSHARFPSALVALLFPGAFYLVRSAGPILSGRRGFGGVADGRHQVPLVPWLAQYDGIGGEVAILDRESADQNHPHRRPQQPGAPRQFHPRQAGHHDVGDQQRQPVDLLHQFRRLVAARRLHHREAEIDQLLAHHLPDIVIVLRHQRQLTGPASGLRLCRCRFGLLQAGYRFGTRQQQGDGGSLPPPAVDAQIAARLLDEAVDHRQPQAGTEGLGREEGLHRAGQRLRRETGAGVGDADFQIIVGPDRLVEGLVALQLADADGDVEPSALRHGIARVDGKVDQRILQLGLVDDGPAVPPLFRHADGNGAGEGPAQQNRHVAQQTAQFDGFRLQRLLAGEGEQAAGDVGAAAAGALGRLQIGVEPLHRRVAVARRRQVADDDRQQIVEVVRQPAGQLADRLQPLRLHQLALGLLLVGDVEGQDEQTGDRALVARAASPAFPTVRNQRGLGHHVAAVAREGVFEGHHLTRQAAVERGAQRRHRPAPDDRRQFTADDRRLVAPDQIGPAQVGEGQPAIAVQPGDAGGDGIQDHTLPGLRLRQRGGAVAHPAVQRGDGVAQLAHHAVEGGGQQPDLVAAADAALGAEVAGPHLHSGIGQPAQRPDQPPDSDVAQQAARRHQRHADGEDAVAQHHRRPPQLVDIDRRGDVPVEPLEMPDPADLLVGVVAGIVGLVPQIGQRLPLHRGDLQILGDGTAGGGVQPVTEGRALDVRIRVDDHPVRRIEDVEIAGAGDAQLAQGLAQIFDGVGLAPLHLGVDVGQIGAGADDDAAPGQILEEAELRRPLVAVRPPPRIGLEPLPLPLGGGDDGGQDVAAQIVAQIVGLAPLVVRRGVRQDHRIVTDGPDIVAVAVAEGVQSLHRLAPRLLHRDLAAVGAGIDMLDIADGQLQHVAEPGLVGVDGRDPLLLQPAADAADQFEHIVEDGAAGVAFDLVGFLLDEGDREDVGRSGKQPERDQDRREEPEEQGRTDHFPGGDGGRRGSADSPPSFQLHRVGSTRIGHKPSPIDSGRGTTRTFSVWRKHALPRQHSRLREGSPEPQIPRTGAPAQPACPGPVGRRTGRLLRLHDGGRLRARPAAPADVGRLVAQHRLPDRGRHHHPVLAADRRLFPFRQRPLPGPDRRDHAGDAAMTARRILLAASAATLFAALPALAAGDVGQLEKQPINLSAIGMFIAFVVMTLGITYWAASRTRSTSDFYTAGGGITGFQNGLAIAGDYMSAATLLGLSSLLLRRLADHPVPAGRAATQPRPLHLRRHRLIPAGPGQDPHLRRHRLADGGVLLPDRPDGRRRPADQAAVRAGLQRGGDRGRRADGGLRHLRRHDRHHLGADHQGGAPAGRRHPAGLPGAVTLRLQPGGHRQERHRVPQGRREDHGAGHAAGRPGVGGVAVAGPAVRHRRPAAHHDALLHRPQRARGPQVGLLRLGLHRLLLPDRLRAGHGGDHHRRHRPAILRRRQGRRQADRRRQHAGDASGQGAGRRPVPRLPVGGRLRHHPGGGVGPGAGRRLGHRPRPLRPRHPQGRGDGTRGNARVQDRLAGAGRAGRRAGHRLREAERRLPGRPDLRRRGVGELPGADPVDVLERADHPRRAGGRHRRPDLRRHAGDPVERRVGRGAEQPGADLPLRAAGPVLDDAGLHRHHRRIEAGQQRVGPCRARGLRGPVRPFADRHRCRRRGQALIVRSRNRKRPSPTLGRGAFALSAGRNAVVLAARQLDLPVQAFDVAGLARLQPVQDASPPTGLRRQPVRRNRPACAAGGEADGGGSAAARFAVDGQAAAMQGHQVATDRQAQPGAAEPPGNAAVGLLKRLKDAGQRVGGDADAGIAHGDGDPAILLLHRTHRHLTAARGEFDRVRQQVQKHLAQGALVGQQIGQVGGTVDRQRHPAGIGRHRGQRPAGLDGFPRLHPAFIQRVAPGLQLRHVQHVVDEVQQVAAAVLHMAGIVAVARAAQRTEQLVQHDVGKADDGVQRRAQFVAHGRQEGALGPVGGFCLIECRGEPFGGLDPLGDVARLDHQHRDDARVVIDRLDRHIHHTGEPVGDHIGLVTDEAPRGRLFDGLAESLRQFVRAGPAAELPGAVSNQRFGRQAGQSAGRPVQRQHPALRRQQPHDLETAVEQRLRPPFAGAQRLRRRFQPTELPQRQPGQQQHHHRHRGGFQNAFPAVVVPAGQHVLGPDADIDVKRPPRHTAHRADALPSLRGVETGQRPGILAGRQTRQDRGEESAVLIESAHSTPRMGQDHAILTVKQNDAEWTDVLGRIKPGETVEIEHRHSHGAAVGKRTDHRSPPTTVGLAIRPDEGARFLHHRFSQRGIGDIATRLVQTGGLPHPAIPLNDHQSPQSRPTAGGRPRSPCRFPNQIGGNRTLGRRRPKGMLRHDHDAAGVLLQQGREVGGLAQTVLDRPVARPLEASSARRWQGVVPGREDSGEKFGSTKPLPRASLPGDDVKEDSGRHAAGFHREPVPGAAAGADAVPDRHRLAAVAHPAAGRLLAAVGTLLPGAARTCRAHRRDGAQPLAGSAGTAGAQGQGTEDGMTETVIHLGFWELLIGSIVTMYMLIAGGWVLAKAGRSPLWILLLLFPYLNVLAVWAFAFIRWPFVDRAPDPIQQPDRN
ncbi:hypothetical protein Lal_00005300 [Lupinus albus]|nr:hypothetical protein Lal_00005300 [Lupinus albus]